MRERGKSRGGEEGRDGGGFEFPFPFGQKGREGGFRNPPFLLPRTWEEGVLNSLPLLARRVREEVSISPPLSGQKGEEEGSPAFFWLTGEGAACRTQTPLMSCGSGGFIIPPFSGGGLETVYLKEMKMEQVREEAGRGRIGRRRRGRCG